MNKGVLAIAVVGVPLLSLALPALADDVSVDMRAINERGVWDVVGTIKATDSNNGVVFNVDLSDLPPGAHGFHLHENGNCGPGAGPNGLAAGMAAGGHYDPQDTGRHMGPAARGHLGDLPVIFIQTDEDGGVPYKSVLVAPYLKVSDMRGRALIIHKSGDNYSDEPNKLGGGGDRIACGVVGR